MQGQAFGGRLANHFLRRRGGATDKLSIDCLEITLGSSRGDANYSSYRLLKWLRKAEKTC